MPRLAPSHGAPIRVVNKKTASPDERRAAAYVARGSALGNPYKVEPWGPHERGTTLGLYETWLRERLARRDAGVVAEMNRLWSLARRAQADGGEVLLMCFCAPSPCHADVVKRLLEENL